MEKIPKAIPNTGQLPQEAGKRDSAAPPLLKDLLLSPQLGPAQVAVLLSPYKFKDVRKADANLQLIADEPRARQILSEIVEELLAGLAQSPDPDQALNYLERFTKAALNKVHLLSYLKESPHTLGLLAKLFGSSPFMSEILIRHPTYLYWVSGPEVLEAGVRKRELQRELSAALRQIKTVERKRNILRLFKRKTILRIGVRDLLRKALVEETTAALSDLADLLIQKAYEISEEALSREYGTPGREGSTGRRAGSGFMIIGMGKLGGRELNFSSDVDLIYFYHPADGMTSGVKGRAASQGRPGRISIPEYYKRLSQEVTATLSAVTNEGDVYRVDLGLRPEGKMGPIACPLESALRYYATRGQTWERLALLKARPVAGDPALGRQFLKTVSPFIYNKPFTFEMVDDVRRVKEKIDRKMSARGQTGLNVKLGFGGIREIEFIVQSIQAFSGGRLPGIRERNTLKALRKLLNRQILIQQEYDHLTGAYIFLRDVEHKLQMVHELQTHTLPTDSDELRICALRLDYRDEDGLTATERFLRDHRLHTERVNRIFKSVFYNPDESRILRSVLSASRSQRPVKRRISLSR